MSDESPSKKKAGDDDEDAGSGSVTAETDAGEGEGEKRADAEEDGVETEKEDEADADGDDEDEADDADASDDKAADDGEEDEDDKSSEPKRRNRRRGRAPDAPPPAGAAAPTAEPPKPKPDYVFLAVTSTIFLALDLGTKWMAVDRLGKIPGDKIVVINGFFNLDLAQNKGGAWGLLGDQPDHIRLPFFFLISALAVVFIVSLYRKLEPRQTALKWALPLVLGGALGNLIDRVRHQYVVDFIDWYLNMGGKDNHWPTFNVADVWIVAGVGLMVIDMFTPRRPLPKRAPLALKTAASKAAEADGEEAKEA